MPLSKVQRGLVEVDADIVWSGAVLFIQTLASLLVSACDVMAIRNQCAVRGSLATRNAVPLLRRVSSKYISM